MQDDLAYNPSESQDFERELPDIGTHNAVCCQIHNIGHQLYEGKVSISPKVVMIFELDQKLKSGQLAGKPMTISRTFSYYMAEGSAIRLFLESWRGKPFAQTLLALGHAVRVGDGPRSPLAISPKTAWPRRTWSKRPNKANPV